MSAQTAAAMGLVGVVTLGGLLAHLLRRPNSLADDAVSGEHVSARNSLLIPFPVD